MGGVFYYIYFTDYVYFLHKKNNLNLKFLRVFHKKALFLHLNVKETLSTKFIFFVGKVPKALDRH